MAIIQFYIADSKDEDPSEITNNLRYELPDDHNFSADDDLDSCIEECAGYYHHDCDGWESRFPCLFMLWIDDEYLGIFEVEREFEPVFSAKKGGKIKDRIKFNDAMLAAVMDGRKTQTRRPIEPQPKVTEDELRKLGAWQEGYSLSEQVCAAWRHGFVDVDCPYGEIGDIINIADKDGNIKGKIEITDVWLQQVQEISSSDAIAEGIKAGRYGNEGNWLVGFYIPNINQPYITAKNAFKELWSSIYGIGSWMNNEWVWVIEFKKAN